MKKIIYLLSIVLILTTLGCSSGKTLTMADFTQAYTDAGAKVDVNKKQEFALVYAKDGVLLYMDETPVKIYEYESKKELTKAKKEFEKIMKDWPVNGLFVLESGHEKAVEIFKNVK